MPPFHEGKFIQDLNETHCLLYNTYPICDYHLLITTKEFEHQCSYLTLGDFDACLKAIKANDGVVFLNKGEHAGYTQPHKHFQCIPRAEAERSLKAL